MSTLDRIELVSDLKMTPVKLNRQVMVKVVIKFVFF
jgi:hypothetical protein